MNRERYSPKSSLAIGAATMQNRLAAVFRFSAGSDGSARQIQPVLSDQKSLVVRRLRDVALPCGRSEPERRNEWHDPDPETRRRMSLPQSWAHCWDLPDRRPIWQWAVDSVSMPPGLTRRNFEPDTSRHFLPIFEALQDDHVRQICVRKPLRGGGTLVSDIWHCWTRDCDPGPSMAILQSDAMAKDHFQDRLRPMMTRSPALSQLLPTSRYDTTNSAIKWPDGLTFYISGPGINNLQTKAVRYMSVDECWLLKPGIISEAEGRLGDFEKVALSKLLLISQGSVEDDDFDRRDKEGSCEEWHVQCLHCHEYFRPKFSHKSADLQRGMRWDEFKDKSGNWIINQCLPTVRYECPLCAHPHADGPKTKGEWNRTGKYIQTNPNAPRSKRSFHWPGVIDWPWTKLVELYLTARNAYHQGIIEPTIQFWQKYEAEAKSEGSVSNESLEVRRAPSTPRDDFLRVLTADRQAEGLYYATVFSIAESGAMRLVWYGPLFGAPAIKAKADELTCDNVMIDAGFEAKVEGGVYSICCKYHSDDQRWIAVKGTDDRFFWHQIGRGKRVMRSYSEPSRGDPEQGKRGEGTFYAVLIRFSSPVFNERLDALVMNGTLTIAEGVDPDEFKKHLASEFRKQKRDKLQNN